MTIIDDVKKILDERRIPVLKLSKETGIPSYRLYKWFDGTANPKEEDAKTLLRWAQMASQGARPAERSTEVQKVRVSLIDGRTEDLTEGPTAGTIEMLNTEPHLILDYMKAPFIGEMVGVVEIVGESMLPTFRSGTRCAVHRLPDPALFNPGELYFVVDANNEGFVRRLFQLKDGASLKADNPLFPEFKRTWKQIRAVFKIRADINKQ